MNLVLHILAGWAFALVLLWAYLTGHVNGQTYMREQTVATLDYRGEPKVVLPPSDEVLDEMERRP